MTGDDATAARARRALLVFAVVSLVGVLLISVGIGSVAAQSSGSEDVVNATGVTDANESIDTTETVTQSTAEGTTVYVGSHDNTLYAVDAETGDELWRFTEPSGRIGSSPTVVDGTVYVGSQDDNLYAIDAETGDEEWVFTEPSSNVASSPTVVDGTVYVGSRDDNLYAIDAETGDEEWVFTEPSGWVDSSPAVADGVVYIAEGFTGDGTLYAVDAESGDELWRFTEPSDPIMASPTVVDGTVYVGSEESVGRMYAVDAKTGNQEWVFTELSGIVRNAPAVVDGTVYIGDNEADLYAVDAETGDQEWVFTEPSATVTSATIVDGTVYVGALDGTLHAVDSEAGDQEWEFTEPSGTTWRQPTVMDGIVYIGSADETLYAVDAETGDEEWAFTDPSDEIRSSPTIVNDPQNGDSNGSRVLQGTLGHHNVFAENGPTQPGSGGGGGSAPDCSAVTYAGSGTDADPYEVGNVDQLQCIEEQGLDASYEVVSDIDASETASWNDGKGFEPVGNFRFGIEFTGTFDGKGYNITDLTIERESEGQVGLFDSVDATGAVTNIGIVGADITGSDSDVGGLVGKNDGLVSESYVIGEVDGSEHVGGLIGHNGGGTVTESYARGKVNGSNIVGGLVGRNDPTATRESTITESYATGTVTGSDEVGGLVGWNYGDTIIESHATGSVEGSVFVGGLAGGNYGQITESYATGAVDGSSIVGGLVGQNGGYLGTETGINESYANGSVNGNTFVGSLVGNNVDEGTIDESYGVGSVSGSVDVGGLIGGGDGSVTDSYWDRLSTGQPTSEQGTGLNTFEMIGSGATTGMDGFDFTTTWETVTSPDDYPILAWQSGDSGGGGGTDPSIDNSSFKINPYPVEKGDPPTVKVDVENADSVQILVNGEEAEMNPDGGTTWKKVIDPSEFGSVDNEIGERVELEVVAGSDTLSDVTDAYPRTQLPADPSTVPPTEQIHYYIFRNVEDVPVVLAKFKDQNRADLIRLRLDTSENVTQWERAREYDTNTYMGSGRGSSGSIGFNLEYYDNNSRFHTVGKESYYRSKDGGWKCGFTSDAKNNASLNVDDWVATHPGFGGGAIVDNSCGVFGLPSNDRAYMDMEEGYGVWLEELSHLYFGMGDLYGSFPKRGVSGDVNGGLGAFTFRTGLMASGKSNDVNPSSQRFKSMPQPYSVISRTELNDIGYNSPVDSDYWPWSGINQVDIDTDSDGTTVDIKNVDNIGLDDTVPVLNTNKSAPGFLNGTIKYLFEGDVYEPDVRGYRISKSGVVGKSLNTAVTVDTSVDGEQSLVKDGLFVEFSVRDTKPAKVTVNYNSKSNAKSASLISSVTSDADVLGLADLPNNVTLPDLDLRAVDSQGRVTGVTENGNFVNEIPGAEASGDTTRVEWITVPDDVDVEFEVSSDDVQKFIDETGVSEENVTTKYSTSVTSYGSDTEVIEEDGETVVTGATTETVTEDKSIDPGKTENAVEDTVIAGFGFTPRQPSVGDTVTFEGAFSTNLDGSIQSYSWDLGDGTTATGETVTHSYSSSGEYTVTLTVTGDSGETDTETKTVTVEGGTSANFDVRISGTNSPVEEGDVLTVQTTVTNTGGESDTQTIELDAGSLGTALRGSVSLDVGEQDSFPLSIPTESGDSGTYTATVSGDDDSESINVEVEPATTGDFTVYVGSNDHNVYALDASDGTKEWSFSTGGFFGVGSSSPTVVDGTVYVGSSDYNVYALDASDGTKEWSFETGDSSRSSPTVVDDTVYVAGGNDTYALDASDGTKEWSFETDNAVLSSPTVVDDTVYVGSGDNNTYALDKSDGTVEWSFETGAGVASSPTVMGDTIYVGSGDSNVYALEASDGTEKWSFETGDPIIFSSPTVVDGTVYIGSADNSVYALDASDGTMEWSFETNGIVGSSPTVADGMVYFGSKDNTMYAVDAQSGLAEWKFETDGSVSLSSPTVVDDTVYFGSFDNRVYALDASDGTEKWSFETNGVVESSPTVVAEQNGDSIGSRVDLGTLGHHHVWNEKASDSGLFTEALPGFSSPPTNTQELNPTLYEDLDGDGDSLDPSEAVSWWSELVQNPGDFSSLTQEEVDKLDWNGDGSLTPADAVALWSEKVQASASS